MKHRIPALLGSIIFYVLFLLADGPVWCVDSESYASMDPSREPLYPLYLLFFRKLFGESPALYGQPLYLFPAALTASVLTGLAVWRIGDLVAREWNRRSTIPSRDLRPPGVPCGSAKDAARGLDPRTGELLGLAAMLLQFAVSLLNRFAAKRGSMYSESIMTESLAMPLWLLFCGELWLWLREQAEAVASPADDKGLFQGPGWSRLPGIGGLMLALILLRSQMMIAPLLLCALSLLHLRWLRQDWRSALRRLGLVLMISLLSLLLPRGITRAYNAAVHGMPIGQTFGNKALFCVLMYTAQPEDAALFDEAHADERLLFQEIQEGCEARACLIGDCPGDPRLPSQTLQDHYSTSYDIIGFQVAVPLINDYLEERVALCNGEGSAAYTGRGIDLSPRLAPDGTGRLVLSDIQHALAYDEATEVINDALMKRRPPISIAVVIANFIHALCTSITRAGRIFMPISALLYVLYISLYVLCLRKGRKKTTLAAELVLGSILINSLAVSVTIYGQSRYMIYSMGLFYAVLLLMGAGAALHPKDR